MGPASLAGSADYVRVIRRATRDVVRAALRHGANSADAPTAVREIIASLAERHGASAVRDLAAELIQAFVAIWAVEERELGRTP